MKTRHISISPRLVSKFKNFAHKSSRPILEKIFIKGSKLAATNSYMLLEADLRVPIERCKKATHLHCPDFIKTFKKTDTPVVTEVDVLEEDDSKFPDYPQVFPKGKPKAAVRLNPQLLKQVAQVFEESSVDNSVLVEIYEKHQPAVFSIEKTDCQDGLKALIMPLNI